VEGTVPYFEVLAWDLLEVTVENHQKSLKIALPQAEI
jgi:hypothetical protein